MLITGLRGVGKTVLLTTFEDMALSRGWFPAFRRPAMTPSFASSWLECRAECCSR